MRMFNVYGSSKCRICCSWLHFSTDMHQCWVYVSIQNEDSLNYICNVVAIIVQWCMVITWNLNYELCVPCFWSHGWCWSLHMWHIYAHTHPIYTLKRAYNLQCGWLICFWYICNNLLSRCCSWLSLAHMCTNVWSTCQWNQDSMTNICCVALVSLQWYLKIS